MKLTCSLMGLALGALLLASCGGDSKKTDAPATTAPGSASTARPAGSATVAKAATVAALDPCTLVTKDEAASALGVPVSAISSASTSTDCAYDDSSKGQRLYVETAAGGVDALITLLGTKRKAIDGFGDGALQSDRAIGFIKNGRVIVVGTAAPPADLAAIGVAARVALQRAP